MNYMDDVLGCCGGDGWSNVDSNSNNENSCCNNEPCGRQNPVEACFNTIKDDLCDMKADVAEAKAVLVFLAQTIANNNCGCICKQERQLLLLIERQLNELNCKIKESRANVDCLEDLITC